ncbi:3-oxoacyl-[acyl-carrier-protein] reductase FabG-like [Leguminivora glycinivorella]|uniref:3-oxoacyl-[acyl-carrier-protein] reductase FabG-like n=1 Tax=Leguminivora glycinivorella TaxID=1035111 RepID=UPI00200C4C6A|nr:3-oxoacyl-[acyl-carrier-protein] reductase FabG-like [Leguminivora glycinivorella]
MSFANKVVIVTGASSGIGAATALMFAKEGADVVIVARTQAKLAAVAKNIQAQGRKALVIQADLSKEADVATVVPKTIKEFGKLDVLVNNAGMASEGCLLDGKALQAYDEVMKTNVRAVVQLTSLAAPYLIQTKGNVVNVSSVAGLMTSKIPTLMFYSVSKAALGHFTRCSALELAASGVRVNSVNPGPVENDFIINNKLDVQDLKGNLTDFTALGYIAKDDEIGRVILFLASDKARSITGSTYVIDNGCLLK